MLKKVTSWKADDVLGRLMRNAGVLMSGNLLAAVITLLGMAVTARALGPEGLGVFFLVTTFVMLVDRLLNFQSWQLLIKAGTEAIESKNQLLLRQLLKFSVFLDVGSAVLSTVVALVGAPVIVHLMGLAPEHVLLVQIYAVTILFNWVGMPTGVLRLYNRFHLQAMQKVLVAVLSLLAAIVAWLLGASLMLFVALTAAAVVVGQVFLFIAGWRELGKQGHKGFMGTPLHGFTKAVPDAWSFVIYTNIESAVKIIRELDIFIVKAFLSVEAVGFYKLARQLVDALNLLITPFFQAVFPEISRFVAKNDMAGLKRLAVRSSAIVGGVVGIIWLGFIVLGSWFIQLVFGEAFAPAYILAVICMLGIVFWGFAQPLSPIFYSMGKVKAVFHIHLVTALLYILMLVYSLKSMGLLGAAAAYTAFYALWCATMFIAVSRHLTRK